MINSEELKRLKSLIFAPHQDTEPTCDILVCNTCEGSYPVKDCPTEQDGDWETGYYTVHICPKCYLVRMSNTLCLKSKRSGGMNGGRKKEKQMSIDTCCDCRRTVDADRKEDFYREEFDFDGLCDNCYKDRLEVLAIQAFTVEVGNIYPAL